MWSLLSFVVFFNTSILHESFTSLYINEDFFILNNSCKNNSIIAKVLFIKPSIKSFVINLSV